MNGCGVILSHHAVAQINENKSDEFGDVQDLHVPETGSGPANTGKQRPNGNEDVAEETESSAVAPEIFDGRVNRTAKEKNKGVDVEERRKAPDPLPRQHSSREALIETLRNCNRREQDTHC